MRVSVSMVTYNHEPHIAQAIESVLAQEHAGFEVELVIGEDCSTDDTAAIVHSYAQRYPDVITVVTGQENVGQQRNVARVIGLCTGDYIAVLDGDDYWTSPQKLKTQVAFMESNPGCAVCFHDVLIVDDVGDIIETPETPLIPAMTRIEDLLIGNYIASCSIMYRGGLLTELPKWWNDVEIADLPLSVMHAQFGWIGYIDQVMGAYRRHAGGVFSVQNPSRQVHAHMAVLRKLDDLLAGRYHAVIRRALHRLQLSLIATRLFEIAPALRPLLRRMKPVIRHIHKPVG